MNEGYEDNDPTKDEYDDEMSLYEGVSISYIRLLPKLTKDVCFSWAASPK